MTNITFFCDTFLSWKKSRLLNYLLKKVEMARSGTIRKVCIFFEGPTIKILQITDSQWGLGRLAWDKILLVRQKPLYYWPQMSIGMACFPAVARTVSFIHRLQKYVQDYEFHDCVMHQSPPPGTLLHCLFANLLSFARHKSRCVTEKRRYASNLVLWRNCNSCAANCGHLCQEMFVMHTFCEPTMGDSLKKNSIL